MSNVSRSDSSIYEYKNNPIVPGITSAIGVAGGASNSSVSDRLDFTPSPQMSEHAFSVTSAATASTTLPAASIPAVADDKHSAAPSVAKLASASFSLSLPNVSKRTAEELSSLSDSADATTLTRLRVAVLREKYPYLAARADSGATGDYNGVEWEAVNRSGSWGQRSVHEVYRSRSIPAAFAPRITEPVSPYAKQRSLEELNSFPLGSFKITVAAAELNHLSDEELLKLGPSAVNRVRDLENLELRVLTGVSPVTLQQLLPGTIYKLPPDLSYGLVDYIRENA